MSQHDLNIANQTRTNFRQDLNSALEAIASKQSGSGDPTITYPYQEKIDTSASPAVVYIRKSSNDAWVRIGYVDATTGQLIMDDTTDAVNSENAVNAENSDKVDGYDVDDSGASDNDPVVFDVTNSKLKKGTITVVGSYENLKIINNTTHSTYQLDVTADKVQFINGLIVSSFSKTVDITASGANGLDTGSETSSTWCHIWAIAKTDGTNASLLSTSATAPTMPSGYTLKCYLGAVYNNASSNFVNIRQRNKMVVTDAVRVVDGGSATSYTSVSLASAIPSTAVRVFGYGGHRVPSTRYWWIAATSSGIGALMSRLYALDSSGAITYFDMLLDTAQTIYYKGDAYGDANGIVDVIGWGF